MTLTFDTNLDQPYLATKANKQVVTAYFKSNTSKGKYRLEEGLLWIHLHSYKFWPGKKLNENGLMYLTSWPNWNIWNPFAIFWIFFYSALETHGHGLKIYLSKDLEDHAKLKRFIIAYPLKYLFVKFNINWAGKTCIALDDSVRNHTFLCFLPK